MFERVVSYLLVAILPGEVQQAGGEQLVFAPGIPVHGVRASGSVSGDCADFWFCRRTLLTVFPRRVSSLCSRLLFSSAPPCSCHGAAAVCWRCSWSRGRRLLPKN
ncbi:hypothetical protein CgunFtcFv8_006474 [Champsocephalus gunnari]|uniref:Uncharacterized protein n=1 Tax=Champsocephalus gunnari TaxID=52237 RepID=A0AAN8GWZ9_CHAGU|nr:hypothetical protein CgunFtcFv8_006474 [Champsocephalus gunnari]